jgi:hypothetical protein
MPTRLSYDEAKKKLDKMYDIIEETNIHQKPKLFAEMLRRYNAIDNYLWEAFHDTDREEC